MLEAVTVTDKRVMARWFDDPRYYIGEVCQIEDGYPFIWLSGGKQGFLKDADEVVSLPAEPPLWSLFVPRCPFCNSPHFRLLTQVYVQDGVYYDEEDGEPYISREDSDRGDIDPKYPEIIECDDCGDEISGSLKEQVLTVIRKAEIRW